MKLGTSTGSKLVLGIGLLLLFTAIIVLRDPATVKNPQFYAEDGRVWYANAYNLGGLHALTLPEGGYLNTLPRIVAWLSLLVPFSRAPLVMNLCGVLVQALPALYIVSTRCCWIGPVSMRAAYAAIYLLLPNSREVNVVITNAQFHWALLAFLVVFATPPTNWYWKVFDIFTIALSAVSGPFDLVLLPLLGLHLWMRKERWTLILGAVMAPLACLQLAEVLTGYTGREPGNLGASPMLFARLLSGHVFVACLFGQNGFAWRAGTWLVFVALVAGVSILGFTLWKSNHELRFLIAYALLLFAAGLSKPLITGPLPQWELLAHDAGARYWFLPTLAFAWALLWCARQKESRFLRLFSSAALLVMIGGTFRDLRYRSYADMHFEQHVAEYDQAPVGSTINIPIYPDGLLMKLTKKFHPSD